MKRGIFISFEGPDGSGKSTQIRLLTEYCREKGLEAVTVREPGGTAISEKIREIILDKKNSEMSPVAEALLYAASRAQLVEQIIRPALEEGKMVLSDRFMDSSIAYQGYGRGLGDGVRIINEFAVRDLQPDLTFFLDLDPVKGKQRVLKEGEPDRLESEAMTVHRAVYEGYKKLSLIYPQRFVTVDADRPVGEIASDIREAFDRYVLERA
ncbi:MAG: dTMP kinase [Firmicutes bacterium]|nr:dTMP kinase [Bacillota bacterium]